MTRLLSSLATLAAAYFAAWITRTSAQSNSSSDSSSNGVIVVRGNKLYNAKTGERFMLKGMTYEYAVSDKYYTQYSKAAIAENLKGLKFNALRVYNINPDESYKLFMNDMEALGVYVLVAASPDNSDYFGKYRYATMRKDLPPEASDGNTCYPALLLEYGKKIALNFAQYDNTLGMILANEIMQVNLMAGACVKQYAADLKTWMRANSKMMRMIPLAYAAADSSYDNPSLTSTVLQPEDYHVVKIQGLLCGDTMKNGLMQKSIDIYLINEYRWCDDATYDATYAKFLEIASGMPIAIAFGEYGCHNKPYSNPRKWPMVPYLYQAPSATEGFTNVFSGGLAYSYGEAKLDLGSGFPMFTGGSLDFLSTPSSKPTTDYTNLKSQFAKYSPYSDPADWTSDTKCTWAPTVTESISSTNKRATKSGWLVSSCSSSDLKIASTDTWVAKSRQGAVCDSDGGTCDVKVSSAVGTTQNSICGGTLTVVSGGGNCNVSSDCGTNGQCLKVNGTNQCSCLACWSGSDCSIKDTIACSTLSSSKNAPKIVFSLVGVFLGFMLVAFIALAFVAAKRKKATQQLADQVKSSGPGTAAGRESASL